ncbi:MAG TPA: hypothetical protein VK250_00350 [Nitrososphaeraceae archaeon]|jgi:flagellar biosynthesis component FlhA|nr:hypothetical protein [Nitrososphaeraceae archaeon]
MNNKSFLYQQLKWIAIYFVISFIISIIVPFPYSLIVIVSIVLILSIYIRRREMARFKVDNFSMFDSNKVNYYCMMCDTKHNNLMCPKCGSKMKRIG